MGLNTLVNFGVTFYSPLFIQVGTMLLLPLSVLVDDIVLGVQITWMAVVGTLFVVSAFLLISLATSEDPPSAAATEPAPLASSRSAFSSLNHLSLGRKHGEGDVENSEGARLLGPGPSHS
eukprot:GILI01029980.1.p1 GENE.GILI01029980.1~~GILI01029980.1.p1  ORF type:complete len:135 (-),score=35.92 GILI01029980.1:223-582(-)